MPDRPTPDEAAQIKLMQVQTNRSRIAELKKELEELQKVKHRIITTTIRMPYAIHAAAKEIAAAGEISVNKFYATLIEKAVTDHFTPTPEYGEVPRSTKCNRCGYPGLGVEVDISCKACNDGVYKFDPQD